MNAIKNAESQMTLDRSERNAEKSDSTSGKLVPICCMIVTVMASINGNFMTPFFSPFSISRGIPSKAYSIVEGTGDGIYIFGYFFYLALVKLPTKKVAIFSILTFTLTGFLFGFAGLIEDNSWFIGICTVLRALSRISLVATKISIHSILLMLKNDKKGATLGIIAVCMALGEGIAQIYSGLAFNMWGFFAPFIITSIFNVLTFIFCIISFKNIHVQPENKGNAQMMTALKDGQVMVNLLGIMAIGVCSKFSSIFVSSFLSKQFQMSETELGLFFAFCFLVNSIIQKIMGHFMDRKMNIDVILTITLTLIVTGMICYNPPSFMGFEKSVISSVVCFILILMGIGTKYMCHNYEVISRLVVLGFDQTKINVYILVTSIFFIFLALGYLVASICLGYINDRYGFTGACYFMISLMAVTHFIKLAHSAYTCFREKEEEDDTKPINPKI